MAPMEGEQVALVLTDIESSTTLWDLLDPSVMDRCLGLHHGTVRRLSHKHAG